MNPDVVDKDSLRQPWRRKLYEIIFEADTPAGKAFDLILIVCILASVAIVMMDSVSTIHADYGTALYRLQWLFTGMFTVEYILRLLCAGNARRYATSFFGVVDFLGVLPMYVGVFFPGGRYLVVIRILRVLRVFRILRLMRYTHEARDLMKAMVSSRRKIAIFLFTVLTLVVILGSLMYIVEDESSGFTSIPRSIYWAIVTLTTVGYGDISPQTALGQTIAAVIMILGYSIIVVPTGLVCVAWSNRAGPGTPDSAAACAVCGAMDHANDATYCRRCGQELAKT